MMITKKFEKTRFCRKCEQDLLLNIDNFTTRKTDKAGFSLYCKKCINREKREERSRKREKWDKGGVIEGGEGRRCTICKNIYPESVEFFGKHLKNSKGLDTYCKPCRRARGRANYDKNKEGWNKTHRKHANLKKQKIREIKENSKGCSKCKEKRYYLLDFHHIDPSTKEFQISSGESKGWERVLKEIEKCILVCKNCHAEFHHMEKLNNITIQEYING